jgi:hypothetical protein
MSDLSDIYYAIQALKHANSLLKEECKPNSNRYETCRNTEHTIKRAEEAYRRLEQKSR